MPVSIDRDFVWFVHITLVCMYVVYFETLFPPQQWFKTIGDDAKVMFSCAGKRLNVLTNQ